MSNHAPFTTAIDICNIEPAIWDIFTRLSTFGCTRDQVTSLYDLVQSCKPSSVGNADLNDIVVTQPSSWQFGFEVNHLQHADPAISLQDLTSPFGSHGWHQLGTSDTDTALAVVPPGSFSAQPYSSLTLPPEQDLRDLRLHGLTDDEPQPQSVAAAAAVFEGSTSQSPCFDVKDDQSSAATPHDKQPSKPCAICHREHPAKQYGRERQAHYMHYDCPEPYCGFTTTRKDRYKEHHENKHHCPMKTSTRSCYQISEAAIIDAVWVDTILDTPGKGVVPDLSNRGESIDTASMSHGDFAYRQLVQQCQATRSASAALKALLRNSRIQPLWCSVLKASGHHSHGDDPIASLTDDNCATWCDWLKATPSEHLMESLQALCASACSGYTDHDETQSLGRKRRRQLPGAGHKRRGCPTDHDLASPLSKSSDATVSCAGTQSPSSIDLDATNNAKRPCQQHREDNNILQAVATNPFHDYDVPDLTLHDEINHCGTGSPQNVPFLPDGPEYKAWSFATDPALVAEHPGWPFAYISSNSGYLDDATHFDRSCSGDASRH